MRADDNYKKLLSVLMLVLYGFIITPVALWHSHACDGQSAVCKSTGTGDTSGTDTDDNCPICDHAYASHIAGDEVYPEADIVIFRLYQAAFCKTIPFLFTGHTDTRGSPVAEAVSFS